MSGEDSVLYKFLNKPINSHAKESILMNRLCLDLKVVAATHDYYLNTYWDDVDKDGFDLIFDDQNTLIKTQVKSVGVAAGTSSWLIHKRLLRPTIDQVDRLGFARSSQGIGVSGGVVLIKYRVENDGRLEVDYYYTDLYVLLAFDLELITQTNDNSIQAIKRCLNDLRTGAGDTQLQVPLGAFVKAKSPATLLALLGLHSTHGHPWKFDVIQVAIYPNGDSSLKIEGPIKDFKEKFHREFRMMVQDDEPRNTEQKK